MCKRIFILLFASLILTAITGFSQMTVSFELQPMYMGARGPGYHILDEITLHAELTDSNIQYSTDTKKIYLQPAFSPSVAASVGVNLSPHAPTLGFYAHGWLYGFQGAKSHYFQAAESTDQEINRNMVYLWDGNYRLPFQRNFWVPNREHPSGCAPIDWESNLSSHIYSVNAQVSFGIIRDSKAALNILGGAQSLWVDHSLKRKIEMTALVWTRQKIDHNHIDFRNHITLQTEGSSSLGFSVGPSIGVNGSTQLGALVITATATHAWIPTQAKLSNRFIDIDDFQYEVRETGEVLKQRKYKGDIPFSQVSTATIPVTTLQGKAEIPLGMFKIGISSFYCRWQNVLLTPTLSYRDMTWDEHSKDLHFFGVLLNVGIRF